jgi:hypothetical protein
MAQYALMVWGPADYAEFATYDSADENAAQLEATGAFNERLRAEGHFVFAAGLAEASTATVVDGMGAAPLVSDGPYLESKEYMNGFWVIEAADLDEALRLAAEGSGACRRKVEVRPLQSV